MSVRDEIRDVCGAGRNGDGGGEEKVGVVPVPDVEESSNPKPRPTGDR